MQDIYIIPEAPVIVDETSVSSVRLLAKGFRLGILDNSKNNADHLLELLRVDLLEKFHITNVAQCRKPNAAVAASALQIDQLVEQSDFILGAMAD
jgi:hypothetical protein